jgi:hypothetical protein
MVQPRLSNCAANALVVPSLMLVGVAFCFDAEVILPGDVSNGGFDFVDFVDVAQQLRATAKIFAFELHLSLIRLEGTIRCDRVK